MLSTIPTTILALGLFSLAMARPAPVDDIPESPESPDTTVVESDSYAEDVGLGSWTLEGFHRLCDYPSDQICMTSFVINQGVPEMGKVPCSYLVVRSESAPDVPASRTANTGWRCGPYLVTSSWSDVFGEDKGFTTLSIIDEPRHFVVYPSYSDEDLGVEGEVVTPDRKFALHQYAP